MDRDDLIVQLLSEVRAEVSTTKDSVASLNVEFAKHTAEFKEAKIDIKDNKEDLKAHMAQTKTVKQIALDNKEYYVEQMRMMRDYYNEQLEVTKQIAEQRMDLIEEKLSIKYLLKLIVTVCSGLGAILGVLKYFGMVG